MNELDFDIGGDKLREECGVFGIYDLDGEMCIRDRPLSANKNRIEAKRRSTMSEKMIENNKVSVIGKIVSGFTFSHEVFGEGFYMVDVAVNRLSEQADIIPLMVSERLIDVHEDYIGCTIEALGQFRSYNRHEGVKNRLMLSIFVREVHFMEEFTDYTKTNQIFLDGYICKAPIYRKTPLGREIADILLAVNRPYGKSDYICLLYTSQKVGK